MMKIQGLRKPTPLTDISQIIYGDNRPSSVRRGRPVVVLGITAERDTFQSFGTIVNATEQTKEHFDPEKDYYDQLTGYVESEFEEGEEEELPYNGIVAENEFIVDQEEVEAIRLRVDAKSDYMSTTMSDNLALLYGVDTASNFIEAVASDSLDMPITRDNSIEDALVPLVRLNTMLAAASQLPGLSKEIQAQLAKRLTKLTAIEIMQAFKDGRQKANIEEMRKHYATALTKNGLPPDSEEDFNALGVRASRGNQ